MRRVLIIILAVVTGVSGFYLGSLWQAQSEEPVNMDQYDFIQVGDFRPGFSHGTTTGEIDNIDNYAGKVVLLNFWATWCLPCRKEVPMLQALQEQYGHEGFQVIGIAMDDVSRVRDFIAELGVEYPNLVGAGDVMLTNLSYGNSSGALPYSVLIDRQGTISWRRHGVIDIATLGHRVEKLLQETAEFVTVPMSLSALKIL